MLEEKIPLLVVGLGNPGKNYEHTRHNLGFLIGEALAKQLGCSFQHKKDFLGDLAQGFIGETKVMILLPATYMNLSGQALKRCMDFFKIPPSHIIVVCDDVALPFGKLRLRDRGSSGGHNGLNHIEMTLGSQLYTRLRVGVGRREDMELAEFVLGRFDIEEFNHLPEVIQQAQHTLLVWIKEGYSKAVEYVVSVAKKMMEDEKKIIKDEI